MAAKLYYIHDPMCSWCWAFRSVWEVVQARLPPGTRSYTLLGGLAPDTEQPMPEEVRRYVQANWQRIQSVVPGTRFNFDFWVRCRPRRATYPACRAVIAARRQGPEYEAGMTLAIQEAYYLQAQNPSEPSTLVALAGRIGMDEARFERDMARPETQQRLLYEIAQARRMGVTSFPSLVLRRPEAQRLIDLSYTDPQVILGQIEQG